MKVEKFDHTVGANGKKLFTFNCIHDCQRISPPQGQPVKRTEKQTHDNSDGGSPASGEDDGLIRSEWRLISAVKAWPTSAHRYPQLVDYSHNGGKVLKKVVDIVNGKNPDLMWNHSTDAKDIAGHVENASWDNSGGGPAGVNGTLVVDPEFDQKAAAGLKTGALRAGSIGMNMICSPSHPEMEEDLFYQMQGQVVNNEEVRWLPEEVSDVRHMALVAAGTGADPNSGPANHTSAKTDNRSQKSRGESMKVALDFAQGVVKKLGYDHAIVDGNDQSVTSITDKVFGKLDTLIGIDNKYNDMVGKVEALGAALKKEGETDLSASQVLERLPGILDMAKAGERLVDYKRKEALDWFDKAKFKADNAAPTDAEKRLRERISKMSDLDHLGDLIDDYKAQAEALFPGARKVSGEASLGTDNAANAPEQTSDVRDICESVGRMFHRPEESKGE